MSPRLLLLAAEMLDEAAGEFANHGCNDYELPADFTDEDLERIVSLMNRANFRDRPRETWPAEDVKTVEDTRRNVMDWIVMGALAFGLRELAKGAPR